MQSRKSFYESAYKKITDDNQLKWHQPNIAPFIQNHINIPAKKEFALDIGCGAGNNSIFMAQNGYTVTGIDFVEKAVTLASHNAERNGVSINFIHADLFKWRTERKFDLILDSGCLHNFRGKSRKEYKKILLELLNQNAYFLLAHFSTKSGISIWGSVPGNKKDIEQLFIPELRMLDCSGDNDSKLLFYLFQKA
jgi:cyclopropane fatty-acyl-phospholipid synthase-like methyltransferase